MQIGIFFCSRMKPAVLKIPSPVGPSQSLLLSGEVGMRWPDLDSREVRTHAAQSPWAIPFSGTTPPPRVSCIMELGLHPSSGLWQFRGQSTQLCRLAGKLCARVWTCVRNEVRRRLGRDDVTPGMVAAIQTYGGLLHWHPHFHTLDSGVRPVGLSGRVHTVHSAQGRASGLLLRLVLE